MVTREEFKENLLALLDIINNNQKRGFKNEIRLFYFLQKIQFINIKYDITQNLSKIFKEKRF